jgi:molybdate transport system substrate-binding protein
MQPNDEGVARRGALFLFSGLAALCAMPGAAWAQRPPLVLAAASMQDALNAAADAFARTGRPRPTLSFAASSALARQIEAGAPADLFVSADEPWMDAVEARGLLAPRSRAVVAGNRLVLVAPVTRRGDVDLRARGALLRALGNGRLAMADPDAVPAGRYGRAALTKLGLWSNVDARVARAENVRAALALVERGAAPLGIVYATDARASKGVRIIATFAADTHPPIRYPIARLKRSTDVDAELFRRFLLRRQGQAILARYGFTRP